MCMCLWYSLVCEIKSKISNKNSYKTMNSIYASNQAWLQKWTVSVIQKLSRFDFKHVQKIYDKCFCIMIHFAQFILRHILNNYIILTMQDSFILYFMDI